MRRAHTVAELRSLQPAEPLSHPKIQRLASFEIYHTERVSLTSILFSGNDWRWRLRSAEGTVLVESDGYKTERACRAAVTSLQNNAGSAGVAQVALSAGNASQCG